jgi:hypothetical protein
MEGKEKRKTVKQKKAHEQNSEVRRGKERSRDSDD